MSRHGSTGFRPKDVVGSIPTAARTGGGVEPVDGERGVDPVSRSAGNRCDFSDADHLEAEFVAAMADHPRVVVCGGPRCGKTAVAVRASERYGRPVLYGDATIGRLSWSEASLEVARWFDIEGEWIVEGVVCARALRKWMARHVVEDAPFKIVRLTAPVHGYSDGQAAMAKGEATVWDGISQYLSGCMITVPG